MCQVTSVPLIRDPLLLSATSSTVRSAPRSPALLGARRRVPHRPHLVQYMLWSGCTTFLAEIQTFRHLLQYAPFFTGCLFSADFISCRARPRARLRGAPQPPLLRHLPLLQLKLGLVPVSTVNAAESTIPGQRAVSVAPGSVSRTSVLTQTDTQVKLAGPVPPTALITRSAFLPDYVGQLSVPPLTDAFFGSKLEA